MLTQGKAANSHICKAGTTKCLACWLKKKWLKGLSEYQNSSWFIIWKYTDVEIIEKIWNI